MPNGLFVGLPLHGHTNPTLPLARALVGAGHTVDYLSTDTFAAAITATGARYIPYRVASVSDIQSLPDRMEQLAWLLARLTGDVLERQLDELGAGRPDYVITDSVAPWGAWIGRILRIPIVTSISTFAFNRSVIAYGMRHGVRPKSLAVLVSKIRYIAKAAWSIRQLRARYGVAGPGPMQAVIGHSDLNIVYTSRYFQPCADTFDARFVFIGPSLATDLTATATPVADRSAPLAYVSLGTLFNRDTELFELLFEALRSVGIGAIVSTGAGRIDDSFPAPPPNIDLRSWVPQLDVLRQSTVCVTRGGMNTVTESLAMGVPLVIIPHMSEQHIVATRAEELGVGIRLARPALTATRLSAAIREVTTDERYARATAPVRDSFQAAGGVREAVRAIDAYWRR
jgi:MGT family glycosyltransferase